MCIRDSTAEIDDLLFHLLIGGGVLSGEDAFVTSVGVEELSLIHILLSEQRLSQERRLASE